MGKSLNIGIDADGVIFDLEKFQIENGKKWFKRGDAGLNKKAYDVSDIFNVSRFRRQIFWARHIYNYCMHSELMDGVVENIKKWQTEGHKLYNITSRVYVDQDDMLGKFFRWMVEERYRREGIKFDGIDYCSEKDSASDKMIACKKRQINVMIEDKEDNLEAISKNTETKVVCMNNAWNESYENPEMVRADNFDDIDKYVQTRSQEISEITEGLKFDSEKGFKRMKEQELEDLTTEQKIEYFKAYKESLKVSDKYDYEKREDAEKFWKRAYNFVVPAFNAIYNPKVFNKELVPYQKGVIFVSNHLNYLDQFTILPALKNRPIHFLAASELKEMKRGLVYDKAGCVFIDRKSVMSKYRGFMEMANIVSNGGDVFIFPEGTRNNGQPSITDDGEVIINDKKVPKRILLEFMESPVLLSQITGAPIVPIGITDYYKFRGQNLLARVGKPFVVGVDDNLIWVVRCYNSVTFY